MRPQLEDLNHYLFFYGSLAAQGGLWRSSLKPGARRRLVSEISEPMQLPV